MVLFSTLCTRLVDDGWCNVKIPIERFRIYCSNNDVEGKCHIFMTCTIYSDLRSGRDVAQNLIYIKFDD